MLCTNEESVYLTTRNLRYIKYISSWNVLGGRESVKTFAFSSWDTKLCTLCTYTVASALAVTGSVFMWKYRLCLGQ